MRTYNVKSEKGGEYKKWLNSDEAKKLFAKQEKETGAKYMGTFFTILGFGEYDAEDWLELPSFGAFTRIRNADTTQEIMAKAWDFVDVNGPSRSRLMRSAKDVKFFAPPPKS